jgi:hypothetical protein
MGGLLATAWGFLGIYDCAKWYIKSTEYLFILLGAYLASLARNHLDPNPVQPGACAVLAVFLFFGTFVLNIIRMKMPKGIYTSVKYYINI